MTTPADDGMRRYIPYLVPATFVLGIVNFALESWQISQGAHLIGGNPAALIGLVIFYTVLAVLIIEAAVLFAYLSWRRMRRTVNDKPKLNTRIPASASSVNITPRSRTAEWQPPRWQ